MDIINHHYRSWAKGKLKTEENLTRQWFMLSQKVVLVKNIQHRQ